jgi:hypothetical protein
MSARDDGGPAFPQTRQQWHDSQSGGRFVATDTMGGMSLRQYAAIKLCVPDSGLDWLDDMIRQAQRDRFAGQAIAGLAANCTDAGLSTWLPDSIAARAYQYADAVIAERKGGAA